MKPYPNVPDDETATLWTAINFIARERSTDIAEWNNLNVRFFPLYGTRTNDSAASGRVGEYLSAAIASASAISLTSNTSANVTSLALSAGDWQVWGTVVYKGGTTTTVQNLSASISATSATQDTTPGNYTGRAYNNVAIFNQQTLNTESVPPVRVSLPSAATYYLVANSTFATSTCSAFGILQARRPR